MKVRATQNGTYHGGVRKAGEEFLLLPTPSTKTVDGKSVPVTLTVEEQFNVRWMEKVEEPKPEK